MKLIVENDFHDFDVIVEQQNDKMPRFLKVKGPYIDTERKNANGRIYSRKLMEKVVSDFNKTMVETKRAFGELSHPPTTVISPDRVSHRIISLSQHDNVWVGESIVLTSNSDGSVKGTPCGDILASMITCGGKVGMSTRGCGNISEDGRVDEEYSLITIDAVTDPSGKDCWVNGILEAKDFMINVHGDIVEMAYEKFNKGLTVIPTHSLTTDVSKLYVESLIQNFLKSI